MKFSEFLVAAATLGLASGQRALTTGSTTGGVQERKNIVDICNSNGPERTLYFRALQRMQAEDPTELLSWFQVGGIHGRPFITWNGDGQSSGGTGRGYCLHTDIAFLPWHRAYIATFEQSLTNYAKEIAEEYPSSVIDQYRISAANLRAPYWDWAADYNIPDCVGASSISVSVPSGSSVASQSIANPLATFNFPSGASQFGQYVDSGLSTTRTVRCSASQGSAALSEDGLKEQVYSAFTRSTTFAAVSAGTSSTVVAFEQPHNAVHVDAACGNHFSSVASAGFDPLFMLNHVNVDRLWAIWQEIYTTSIPSGSTTGGSWSINSGSSFTSNTGLSPFYRTSSTRWTTSNLIDTSVLGYKYPGYDMTQSSSTRRANANALVNRLYAPGSTDTGVGMSSPDPGAGGGRPINPRRPVNPRRVTKREIKREILSRADNSTQRYFVKIEVDTSKLPTLPISLKFYIEGDIAGCFTLLNAPEGTIAKGEVPLHRALTETGYHDKYTDGEMEDKIEEALQVVFNKPDGTIVPAESVAGAYTLDVESAELIPNKSILELPKFGQSSRRRIKPDLLNSYPTVGLKIGGKGGKSTKGAASRRF